MVALEETNKKLAPLKAEHDATKGTSFPPFNFGNKNLFGEKVRDKQRDLGDVESILRELQNKLKNVRFITSSQPWLLLRDHLEKSKLEVIRYQTLYDKLQMEKENLAWREMELSIKNDMVDVYRRCSVVADSRMTDLGMEIQKQSDERKMIEVRMAEASKEPGRQEIITDFKALLSTFPEEMQTMQSQLSKYKEDAVDIHSLRAEVQALSSILNRKVEDIKQSDMELNLFLDMYRRESIDSRDVAEAKDLEYKAWARVQSLKSSLDEHSLELRVKTAIEAEATSQQRLAAAEAEIAELRQKLEASKREMSRLTGALKSKIEENEAYLSEIELVLEGVKARQIRDSLLMERQTLEKQIQQATASIDFFNMKVGRMEDQLQINSEKVQKLGEDRMHNSYSLDNTQKRLSEVRKISQQVGGSLGELESQVEDDRGTFAERQIELERER
ncbi:hypothetical protein CRG98_024552 [Punica granatum]|uniref:E3 ubiquitin protein ligase n=1 Tax=Punica granatum TaxID=22663 RepID=A0A2I0JFJ9_PUNGR|nr:hypothetical protein CRG98_024552 [Punica granatum]